MALAVELGADPDGLEFDPASHTYRYRGTKLPSVTTVLDRYSGLEHVAPDVLEAAAELGTHVHAACHLFNEERLDRETLDPALLPYVQAWERFLTETGAVVLHSERRVVSPRHGYAGTLDTIVAWGKREPLIDIKSTTSLPRTVGPQTAAYAEAWQEMTGRRIRDRYCVHLKPDGRYALHKLDDPRDWQVFKAALVVHQWLARS